MKTMWTILLILETALMTCRSQESAQAEDALFKRILLDYIRKGSTTNIVNIDNSFEHIKIGDREVVFALGLRNDQESLVMLRSCITNVSNHPGAKFYSAVALAARGDTNALPVLRGIFTGETPFQTSSGFEASVAGLSLLVLGKSPPKGFSFSKRINPLFPQVDTILENRKQTPNQASEAIAPQGGAQPQR